MDEVNRRIERLEEGQAFADRTSEQLSEELVRAFEAIERLMRRIDGLERRLASLGDAALGASGRDPGIDPAVEHVDDEVEEDEHR